MSNSDTVGAEVKKLYTAAIKMLASSDRQLVKYCLDKMKFMKVTIDPNKDRIAYTDGIEIALCHGITRYVASETAYIILHECLHQLQNHPKRGAKLRLALGDKYNHKRYNLACDVATNAILDTHAGMFRYAPSDRITGDKLYGKGALSAQPSAGMSAEEVYELFLDDDMAEQYHSVEHSDIKNPDGEPEQSDDSKGDTSDNEPDAEGESDGDASGEDESEGENGSSSESEGDGDTSDDSSSGGGDDESEEPEGEGGNSDKTGDTSDPEEREVLKEKDEEVDQGGGCGLSGGIRKQLSDTLSGEKFYNGAKAVGESVLRNYIGSRLKTERSFTRFNKRTRCVGLYTPAEHGEDAPESVAIGFDMSSSQDPKSLEKVIAIIKRLRRDHPLLDMEIFGWGTDVHSLYGQKHFNHEVSKAMNVAKSDQKRALIHKSTQRERVEILRNNGRRLISLRPRMMTSAIARKCVTNDRKAVRMIKNKEVVIGGGTRPLPALHFTSKYLKSDLLILITDCGFSEMTNPDHTEEIKRHFGINVVIACCPTEEYRSLDISNAMALRNAGWPTVILDD